MMHVKKSFSHKIQSKLIFVESAVLSWPGLINWHLLTLHWKDWI